MLDSKARAPTIVGLTVDELREKYVASRYAAVYARLENDHLRSVVAGAAFEWTCLCR